MTVVRLRFAFVLGFVVGLPAMVACSDTPRGEQGIDFATEAGAGPLRDAGPDTHGPCFTEPDTQGTCTAEGGLGEFYIYRVVCTIPEPPAFIQCIRTGGFDGVTTYCCTTGPI